MANLPRNAEGKKDFQALAYGMGGVAVAAGGGLALSALANQYYQQVLHKERNLRPISDIVNNPDAREKGLAVLENLNRVGTFGLFGELANTVMNVGKGGDNRELSIDGRVIAVQSLLSMFDAVNSFIAQGFNADYTHVIRPAFNALGGTSLLQYMQIANNAQDGLPPN